MANRRRRGGIHTNKTVCVGIAIGFVLGFVCHEFISSQKLLRSYQYSSTASLSSSTSNRVIVTSSSVPSSSSSSSTSWSNSVTDIDARNSAQQKNNDNDNDNDSKNEKKKKKRQKTKRKPNRIIYFLHLHKTAGSTMCEAARQNNMSVHPDHFMNCKVQNDWRCCGGNDTLRAQQEFAMTTPYNFVTCESYMYDKMDTQHYRYVVILRDSRDRYHSHYKYVLEKEERKLRKDYGGSLPFSQWWEGQPDNWMVRKMCGTQCMHVPKYQLTWELFNYTVWERLPKFEDVLFVEDFTRSYRRFSSRVGWDTVQLPGVTNKGPDGATETAEATTKTRETFPTAIISNGSAGDYENDDMSSWDPLMSALDDTLYDLARQRMLLDDDDGNGDVMNRRKEQQHRKDHPAVISPRHQERLNEYFAKGKLRKCTHPCCSEKCSLMRSFEYGK